MTSIAVSRDGKRLASAVGHQVQLWDIASGRRLRTLDLDHRRQLVHAGPLAFSPDGRTLAIGTCGFQAVLWEADGRAPPRQVHLERVDSVSSLAFSADGGTLAVATHYDDIVWLHDTASGRLEGMIDGHVSRVAAVAYAFGGHELITGGSDGLVCAWDARTRRLLRVIEA